MLYETAVDLDNKSKLILSIKDRHIVVDHIEEIEVDNFRVIIYLTSGRRESLEFSNYEKALGFQKAIFRSIGYKNVE